MTTRTPAPSTQTAIADAKRMLAQKFSQPNIIRTLTQKHRLTPAAAAAILNQLTAPR